MRNQHQMKSAYKPFSKTVGPRPPMADRICPDLKATENQFQGPRHMSSKASCSLYSWTLYKHGTINFWTKPITKKHVHKHIGVFKASSTWIRLNKATMGGQFVTRTQWPISLSWKWDLFSERLGHNTQNGFPAKTYLPSGRSPTDIAFQRASWPIPMSRWDDPQQS